MKLLTWKFACLIIVTAMACQQKSGETQEQDHEHDATQPDVVEATGNQALYNQVMKIHDEVMPRMNDIHKVKQELKEKITNTPDMSQAERIKMDAMIARLDSAGKSMMDWMHEFKPLPDSLGEEKARAYLESEIERVKIVRENINTALEQAKTNQ